MEYTVKMVCPQCLETNTRLDISDRSFICPDCGTFGDISKEGRILRFGKKKIWANAKHMRCKTVGCQRYAVLKGYCCTHYRIKYRNTVHKSMKVA